MFVRTPVSVARVLLCTFGLVLGAACSSGDDDDDAQSNGAGGSVPFNFGGQSSSSSSGGASSASGGRFTFGGQAFGGSSSGSGGKSSGGSSGAATASGGSNASAGSAGLPAPGPNGESPYVRECHGETAMCGDVDSLRCLGIRAGEQVFGYGCSNVCQSKNDCSSAPSGVEAAADCVDFVTSRYCLLVCQEGGKTHACPGGMSCYVYPGSTIGYCLWP